MNRTIKILARGEMTTRSKKGNKIKKAPKNTRVMEFSGIFICKGIKHWNESTESERNSSLDDVEKLAYGIKLSLDLDEAKTKYLQCYASRIIKRNTNN